MLRPFQTEEVTVITTTTARDELGEVTESTEQEATVDVLVCFGSTSDLDATRPEGDKVVYTLHFPKTWSGSLKGARVRVRGELFRVSGDPQPYTAENCPTLFNMPVEVVRVDG